MKNKALKEEIQRLEEENKNLKRKEDREGSLEQISNKRY
jgi:hypothetical protein